MVQREEGYFKGYKNCELFFQTWRCEQSIGTLVVTHGLGEHSECYNLFANGMLPGSWDIVAWDLRGHGRSEGKRGLVESFEDYYNDLLAFIEAMKKEGGLDKRPFILLGHSMGGLITLRTAMRYGLMGAQGLCLSSPLLGIAADVPPLKDLAAQVLFKIIPSFTMGNELKYEDLSRDPKVVYSYEHDPLRNDRISIALYMGMLQAIEEVKYEASTIKFPVLMQLSGQDRIVSTRAAEEVFAKIESAHKKKIIYHESFHEIFNDLDRQTVYRDLKEFLAGFAQ